MNKDTDRLDSFEKDLLLQWFLHHMPMGSAAEEAETTKATRFAFMREYPALYNKLAGKDVVRVMHLATGTPA